MAALPNEVSFFGLHVTFGKPRLSGDSVKAREFANRVYKETKGPTPELRRLYAKLQDHEQRTKR